MRSETRHSSTRNGRGSEALEGTLVSALARLITTAAGLIALRIAIEVVGTERYGVIVTLTSLTAWLTSFDLGISNSITNHAARSSAVGNLDALDELASSSFWALSAISCCIVIVIAPAIVFVDWRTLLGISSDQIAKETAWAVFASILLFAVGLPLGLAQKLLWALGRQRAAAMQQIVAGVGTLIALVCLREARYYTTSAMVLALGVPTQIASAVVLFRWQKRAGHGGALRPALVKMKTVRALLNDGGYLFATQLAGVALFQCNAILVANRLGAEQATPYGIAFRIASYALLIPSLALTVLWPAFARAIAEGEHRWAVRALRNSVLMAGTFGCLAAVLVVVASRPFVEWWFLGRVRIDQVLLFATAGWVMTLAPMQVLTAYLNATGHFRSQLIFSLATLGLHLSMVSAWIRSYGSGGALASLLVAYAAGAVVPQLWLVVRDARQRTRLAGI